MKRYILAAVLTLSATALCAQNFQGANFLDNFHFGYRFNPARQNDTEFRAGFLNSLTADTRSNFGLNNFIFPVDDHLATGLNYHVPAEQFLSKLPKSSVAIASIDVGLFARGILRNGLYHTVEVNVRTSIDAKLPYDLFAFLKQGVNGASSYDLSTLHANNSNYLELAYGLSVKSGNLSYGFRVKPLVGISYANLDFNKFTVNMSESGYWGVNSEADIEIAGNQFSCSTSETKDGRKMLNTGSLGFHLFAPSFSGVGLAADLGVEWNAGEYFDFGLSVIDLGFLKWFDKLYARTPDVSFTYDPRIKEKNPESNENVSYNIADIASFYAREKKNSARRIPMTVNATARMKMPFYDALSFALSGMLRNSGNFTFAEGRFYTIWTPRNWVSANISCGYDNFGLGIGTAVNFSSKELNFFIGTDSYLLRVTPQMIPVGNLNTNLAFGISHML